MPTEPVLDSGAFDDVSTLVALQVQLVSAPPIPVPSGSHQWTIVEPGGHSIRSLGTISFTFLEDAYNKGEK
jgi:hypothetical protein